MRRLAAYGWRTIQDPKFYKYLFVGFSTVAIDYIVLFLLRELLKEGLFSAVTIAYWTSIIFNFAMNRHWTFGVSGKHISRQLKLYAALLVFNYLLTVLVVTFLESRSFNEYGAKAVALALTISWTFVIYQKYIFVSKPEKS